jgi:hypothetical protein
MEASQIIALVYVSAAFSRSLNASESAKCSRWAYFASELVPDPDRTDRWTPQYSHSMDCDT